MRNLGSLVVLVLALSCVSRTIPDARVGESLALTVAATVPLVSTDPAVFTFSVIGDLHIGQGNTDRLRSMLTASAADGDEFVLIVGDIADQADRSDFVAFQQAVHDTGWDGKVFSVAGNHDIYNAGWSDFKDLLGASTYSFTAGNSKFIALDSADATLGTRQTQWLRGQLAGAHTGPVFVFSHYLPVVPGVATYLKLSNDVEALNLMSLAARSGVTAWLGGHYHSYIQDTIDGVHYVVTGGGGGRRMPPYKRYHYVRVSVNGATASFEPKPFD